MYCTYKRSKGEANDDRPLASRDVGDANLKARVLRSGTLRLDSVTPQQQTVQMIIVNRAAQCVVSCADNCKHILLLSAGRRIEWLSLHVRLARTTHGVALFTIICTALCFVWWRDEGKPIHRKVKLTKHASLSGPCVSKNCKAAVPADAKWTFIG